MHHFDLYRLSGLPALQRLDLPSSFAKAVNLIEWPDRLESATPESRLDLRIDVLNSVRFRLIVASSCTRARKGDFIGPSV